MNALVKEAGLTESMAKTVKVCPTTAHYEEVLPNGRPWYVPFWLDVQKILIPAAMARFLDMHKDNISDESIVIVLEISDHIYHCKGSVLDRRADC